ncbi:hypothetical protein BGZ96_008656 [Linnemannia gamsii]|uniref:LysM domain-containing protein n=1 Tax=Linnemannia gamsii TaxID=64522 RepID=A0ABQ7JXX4_9FUNG|nr:hypothetical protein BGZ96_008656 [Linnemannia gamsii]
MKFTLCATILALAITQVMAVPPEPIGGCTKSVIVQSTDTTCIDFAERHGVTFEDLLRWNKKLRRDCKNLDVGHPICVSVTKGVCCLAEDPNKPTTPTTTRSTTSTSSTTSTTTTTSAATTTNTTTTSPPPPPPPPITTSAATSATTTAAVPPPSPIAPTTSAPVIPPLITATTTTTVDVPPTSTFITPLTPSIIDNSNQTGNNAAVATGMTKWSMVLAVAGVILSAVYVL